MQVSNNYMTRMVGYLIGVHGCCKMLYRMFFEVYKCFNYDGRRKLTGSMSFLWSRSN